MEEQIKKELEEIRETASKLSIELYEKYRTLIEKEIEEDLLNRMFDMAFIHSEQLKEIYKKLSHIIFKTGELIRKLEGKCT